jgi:hypothetical protein
MGIKEIKTIIIKPINKKDPCLYAHREGGAGEKSRGPVLQKCRVPRLHSDNTFSTKTRNNTGLAEREKTECVCCMKQVLVPPAQSTKPIVLRTYRSLRIPKFPDSRARDLCPIPRRSSRASCPHLVTVSGGSSLLQLRDSGGIPPHFLCNILIKLYRDVLGLSREILEDF